MKKFFGLALSALLLVACSEQPGYQISGTVLNEGLNGEYVYLYTYGADAVALDSALVENGTFSFKGVQDEPEMRELRFSQETIEGKITRGTVPLFIATFILENGKLIAVLGGEKPGVTGTLENDAWTALLQETKTMREGFQTLSDAMKSEDKEVVAAAEKKYEDISNQISGLTAKYIKDHPDWLSAAKQLYDNRHSLEEGVRRELLASSTHKFKSFPGIDRMIEHLEVLEKVAIGKKFTDIEMPDTKGKTVKLSDYAGKGKVVLVDFWASWCPPCRADMPHLVELYKQYKNKNFEIVGVSLDRTADAWEKGIKDLNITWPQMSDLKYWQSEGAAIYGVNSIPHTVLIDKDGTIIGKNLRGETLDKKLEEILK